MTRAELSQAIGNINSRYISEAESYFEPASHSASTRRILLIAAVLITILSFCAFGYTYFSSAAGDNLIFTATYSGEGVVLAQIENQSDRDLKLQPIVRLFRYSTGIIGFSLAPSRKKQPSVSRRL